MDAIEQVFLTETEKLALILSRIGQADFRRKLIDIWKGCPINQHKNACMLTASHIKTWRKSEHHERLNPYSGLLVLPNYVISFDSGYICFSDDGIILISTQLQELNELGIPADSKIKLLKEFMKCHRTLEFRN